MFLLYRRPCVAVCNSQERLTMEPKQQVRGDTHTHTHLAGRQDMRNMLTGDAGMHARGYSYVCVARQQRVNKTREKHNKISI